MVGLRQASVPVALLLLVLSARARGGTRIRRDGSRWVLGNGSVERAIETEPFLRTISITNRMAQPPRRHAVESRGFALALDGGKLRLTAADFAVGTPKAEGGGEAATLRVPLSCAKHGVDVVAVYRLGGDAFYLRKRLAIDPGEHLLNWVDVEALKLGGLELQRFDKKPMPFRMVPWDIAVGRPLFAGKELFLGVEHPASQNTFDKAGWVSLRQHPGRRGKVVTEPAVIGACPDRPRERLLDTFGRYVAENRARPVKRQVHWIAYFHAGMEDAFCREKIAVAERVFRQRGAPIDVVLMDSGWTEPQSIMRISSRRPGRVKMMSALVRERLGARLGLHVITSGVKPMVDKDWLAAQGYDMIYHTSKRKGAYCFADPRVFAEFRDNLVRYVKDYGIAAYKFDWGHFACGQAGHRGHLPGTEYGFEAGATNFARVHKALREANPDIFLFNTGWYSPWWLWSYDAVFSAGADYNFGLGGPPSFATSSLLCTWRDATIRGNLVEWSPTFPLNSLMTVDPISYWWHDWNVRAESPLRPFTDYFIVACLRGTQMTEIYNNIAAWSGAHADAAAAVLKWAKAHDDVLMAATRFIGGDPLKGEPYGYAHFARDGRGILVVRNPDLEPHAVTIPFDETAGMWPGDNEHVVRVVYPHVARLPARVRYGSKLTVDLLSHEVQVLEVWPQDAVPAAVAATPPRPTGPAPKVFPPRVDGGQYVVPLAVPAGARARVAFLFRQRGVKGKVTLDGKPVAAMAPHLKLPDAKDRPRGTKARASSWSLFGVEVGEGKHEVRFEPAAASKQSVRIVVDVRGARPDAAPPAKEAALLPQNWAAEARSVKAFTLPALAP